MWLPFPTHALELRKDKVGGGPFTRIMPAPIVFPAYHESVRDNPAALRQDLAWSFQTLGSPNFSNSRHGIDGGAAWSNGIFGVGTFVESTVGPVTTLDDITLGLSSGIGVFSGGASIAMRDFTTFEPQFTVGLLLGRGNGSYGGLAVYKIGIPMTDSYSRLGYGYLNEGAFNFELFMESRTDHRRDGD